MMIDMFEATPVMLNESSSLLPFIEGEVLGVAVETAVLIVPTDLGDGGMVLMDYNFNDDVDGDGEEDDPILVTGTRFGGGGAGGGGGGGSGGGGSGENEFSPDSGGGGGGGGAPTPPPEDTTQDCTDRAAIAAKADIKAEPDDHYKEHGVLTYRAADGSIQRSTPIQGGNGQIPITAIREWMDANGVTFAQVTGWVHNHDPYTYGGTSDLVKVNSYPSGGAPGTGPISEGGGDWAAADWFVRNGVNAATFSLYIINPDNELREFHYRDKAYWYGLSDDQRKRETGLPSEMRSDGSTC